MIAVVDYGMCNIGSVINILRSIGREDVSVVTEGNGLSGAERIILPGVGAFDEGALSLKRRGLFDKIKEIADIGDTPILGICLGMQLLGESSEEGNEKGLGLIPFRCRKFEHLSGLKVPHMGWEYVRIINGNTLITRGLPMIQRYYFVHSYYAVCEDDKCVMMESEYGQVFTAAVNKSNIYGVQFHPEKSHNYGKRIFKNFMEIET